MNAPVKKINRTDFFDRVRDSIFHGKLSQQHVDGINAVLNEWERQALTDLRWLAYMLATDYHETGHTMQPIEEYGKGASHDYGKKLKRGAGAGKRIPYKTPDKIYYGRGKVQLTWYENYELMGRLLGVDLLNHPELALQMDVAVQIMFEGMLKGHSSFGDFTGRSLEMYFNDSTEDWVNARKIINGLDCAKLIAAIAQLFLKALL